MEVPVPGAQPHAMEKAIYSPSLQPKQEKDLTFWLSINYEYFFLVLRI